MASQTLADRGADEQRLVVEESQLHVRRQLVLQGLELRLQARGDVQGAAVGLAVDVEQDGFLAVGGDDVEDGLGAALDAGEIPDADGMAAGRRPPGSSRCP